jgi:hypothetical protein
LTSMIRRWCLSFCPHDFIFDRVGSKIISDLISGLLLALLLLPSAHDIVHTCAVLRWWHNLWRNAPCSASSRQGTRTPDGSTSPSEPTTSTHWRLAPPAGRVRLASMRNQVASPWFECDESLIWKCLNSNPRH